MTMLLSPHDDDAAFSLGAALMDGRFGASTVIAVFTQSDSLEDDALLGVEAVTALRAREHRAFYRQWAPDVGLLDLQRKDAPLRLGIPGELVFDPLQDPSREAEMDFLIKSVYEAGPMDQVILAPLGMGDHVDHLLVRDTALRLAAKGRAVAFYEDLPYSARSSDGDLQNRIATTAALLGRPLSLRLLVSTHTPETKSRALRAYASQRSEASLTQMVSYGAQHLSGRFCERIWGDAETLQALLQ